ncbi:cytokinin riboside 5'-monophosphate phosphoribohydrolase [Levilactobacillus zymae]|uniref:Cytokinin riboside 5'-monophosphate phosphoribohydrolase n=1 Tax=Levilactobacillus zymae TaxID=267363 RepID=A0ABQ0WXH0_9LACO|nr:TIGR00730 family Rossman fold protein [Levilactobacillus zymae]KRL12175.1 Rossmann fold nucleotide-binding protein [Levilactobacillus zymae DSM 19395]QFR61319.1 TIGR00730 family Rossman fold protein [Levilactobacillus zymae]GEO72519.1 cytokinin riboside 5'-monophosphate phosphoribohydrolase [Levilactobacillus zymae]
MPTIKNVCVFCGSNHGLDPAFKQQTEALGHYLAAHHHPVVYGGGKEGLMGTIAESTMAAGGEVIGIIPTFLKQMDLAETNVTKLIETATMDERKDEMLRQADAFIVLPGGFGTFEEFTTMLSWSQLNVHQKPIALFNINHYFDSLVEMMQTCCDQGFAPQANMDLFIDANTIDDIFAQFDSFHHQLPYKYTN